MPAAGRRDAVTARAATANSHGRDISGHRWPAPPPVGPGARQLSCGGTPGCPGSPSGRLAVPFGAETLSGRKHVGGEPQLCPYRSRWPIDGHEPDVAGRDDPGEPTELGEEPATADGTSPLRVQSRSPPRGSFPVPPEPLGRTGPRTVPTGRRGPQTRRYQGGDLLLVRHAVSRRPQALMQGSRLHRRALACCPPSTRARASPALSASLRWNSVSRSEARGAPAGRGSRALRAPPVRSARGGVFWRSPAGSASDCRRAMAQVANRAVTSKVIVGDASGEVPARLDEVDRPRMLWTPRGSP